MACRGHPSTSYRRSSMDAMAGACTSVDGHLIHNPGSLPASWGGEAMSRAHGEAACRFSGAATLRFCRQGRHRVLPLFFNSQAPLSSSVLLARAGSHGQRGLEGQRRMATVIVRCEWRDNVIPFFFTQQSETRACSSPKALQIRDTAFETCHLRVSNDSPGVFPMAFL
jgi:hypothetical protein